MAQEKIKLATPVAFIRDTNDPLLIEEKMRSHTAALADEYEITDPEEIDTFRHTYTAAIVTMARGAGTAEAGGILVEIGGVARNTSNALRGEKADSLQKLTDDSYKDLHNNDIGIIIGMQAQSEQEIADTVAQKVKNRQDVIVEPVSVAELLNHRISEAITTVDGFVSDIGQGISDAFGLSEPEPETPLRPQMLPSRSQQAEDIFRSFGGNLANGLLNESLDFVFDHVFGSSREHTTRSETDRSRRAGSFPSRQQMRDELMYEYRRVMRNG